MRPSRCVLVASWFHVVSIGLAGELPPEARDRIAVHDKAAAKLGADVDREIDAARAKLVEAARKQLDTLSQQVKLDEAIAVRDLIRQVEKAGDPQKQEQVLKAARLAPSTGLAEALASFQQLSARRRAAARTGQGELRAKLVTDLRALVEQLSRAKRLDEALAVRRHLESQADAADGPGASAKLERLGSTHEEALRNYQQRSAAIRSRFDEQLRDESTQFRNRLARLLETTTKAGNLDEALIIRGFLNGLDQPQNFASPFAPDKFARIKISAEPLRVLTEHGARFKKLGEEREAELARLDRAWSVHEGERLREKLRAASLDEARGLLLNYYRLRREMPEWIGFAPNAPAPPASPAVAERLARFEKETAARVEAANVKDKVARAKLVAVLEKALAEKVSPEARDAVQKLARFLQADYGAGMRGLMLLEVSDALPAEAAKAARAYQKDARTQLAELREAHEASFATLSQDLQTLRDAHLDRDEFGPAFAVSTRLPLMRHPFEPIRIKAIQHKGFGHANDALLRDAREDTYLVSWPFGNQEEWLPRERIFLTLEEAKGRTFPAPPRFLGDDREKKPGKPVTETTRLERGQKVLGFWGGRWASASVKDLSPFGVLIHWEDAPPRPDEFVLRADLRLLSK